MMDREFSSQLNAWLDAVAERYEVAQTLRQTPYETTQVVYRREEGDRPRMGPFVRKVFNDDTGRGAAYERIMRAQASGVRLVHQPILYECERRGTQLEVVMECVPGETLKTMVERTGGGVDVAASVMPLLCDAVSELHESFDQPIIHRDVKPSNVMLCNGRLVLIDLGIARTYREDVARDTVRYGTPGYAPPEQFGYGQTSVKSDVYALGMTLAYCLTGKEPDGGLRDCGFEDARIPVAMREVLVKATQFDPERRHGSARELRQDLERALRDGARAGWTHEGEARTSWWAQHQVLGRIWNGLLAMGMFVITAGCFSAIVSPTRVFVRHALGLRAAEFLLLINVPWLLATYVLADKTRLERHEPFASWAQIPRRRRYVFCLLLVPVCMFLGIAAYLVADG